PRGHPPGRSTAMPSTSMAPRNRGSPMPDARGLRRFVPPSLRERVFDPAVADAVRERRIRRRRARSPLARAGVEILFLFRALAAARECRAMARDARQPFDTNRTRTPMIKQDLVFAL